MEWKNIFGKLSGGEPNFEDQGKKIEAERLAITEFLTVNDEVLGHMENELFEGVPFDSETRNALHDRLMEAAHHPAMAAHFPLEHIVRLEALNAERNGLEAILEQGQSE